MVFFFNNLQKTLQKLMGAKVLDFTKILSRHEEGLLPMGLHRKHRLAKRFQ